MTDIQETTEVFETAGEPNMGPPDSKNEKPEIAEFSQKGYLHLKEKQLFLCFPMHELLAR